MNWAFIIFGAFAVLTVGRIIWEIASKQPEPPTTKAEDEEWSRAIK